jgi:Golgi phosphoprotein 3
MNRSEGLVQRRIVSSSGSSGGLNDKQINSNNIPDLVHFEGKSEDSDHDIDSKETRLTLMEEVLLLGLKDKEVLIFVYNNPNNN